MTRVNGLIQTNGVRVSSPPQDEDDEIEFVGVVVGEERQMSKVRGWE